MNRNVRHLQYVLYKPQFMRTKFWQSIINGVGNYYIEAQTRDQRCTDVIVDYLGKQYIKVVYY